MPPKKNNKNKNSNPAHSTTLQRGVRGNSATLGIENELWETADKLRGHLDSAEMEEDDEPFEQKIRRLTTELEAQFEESARLEAQIRSTIMQSRTQASLRDTLLPKLMRGEMRVKGI